MYIKFKRVLKKKIYYEIVGEVDDPTSYKKNDLLLQGGGYRHNNKDLILKDRYGGYYCYDDNDDVAYYIIDIYSDEYEVFVSYLMLIIGVPDKTEDFYNMVDSYVRDRKIKMVLDEL